MIVVKRISVFCLILVGFTACSDNPALRMRYQAEKQYHQAEKMLESFRIQPSLVTDENRRELANRYGDLTDFCYNAIEAVDPETHPVESRELRFLAFQSASRLSQIFYRGRYFDTCVTITGRMLKELNLRGSQAMTTYINHGRALQGAGQWDSALATYDYTVEKFYPPTDDSAQVIYRLFNLPYHTFYIANMVGDTLGARQRLLDAEAYYMELAETYPGDPVSYSAYGRLARLYEDTRQFERESQILRKLGSAEDTSGTRAAMLRLADLYAGPLSRFDSAKAIYERILAETPETDSATVPLVKFKLSQVAIEEEHYVRAREILYELEEEYPWFFERSPTAQLTRAMAFELDGNWNRAEAEYQLLIEKYRSSEEALTSLLYLANRAKDRGNDEEYQRWLETARSHYRELAQRRSGTIDEAKALSYQATLLQQQDKYEEAAGSLLSIYEKFPDTRYGHDALLSAANIYRSQLDQPAKADSLTEALRASLTELQEDWL